MSLILSQNKSFLNLLFISFLHYWYLSIYILLFLIYFLFLFIFLVLFLASYAYPSIPSSACSFLSVCLTSFLHYVFYCFPFFPFFTSPPSFYVSSVFSCFWLKLCFVMVFFCLFVFLFVVCSIVPFFFFLHAFFYFYSCSLLSFFLFLSSPWNSPALSGLKCIFLFKCAVGFGLFTQVEYDPLL